MKKTKTKTYNFIYECEIEANSLKEAPERMADELADLIELIQDYDIYEPWIDKFVKIHMSVEEHD